MKIKKNREKRTVHLLSCIAISTAIFTASTASAATIDLGRVDLCCTKFIQQYIGSHIIANASDTILA